MRFECCESGLTSSSNSWRGFFRRIAAASPAVTEGDRADDLIIAPGESISGAGEIGLCCNLAYEFECDIE